MIIHVTINLWWLLGILGGYYLVGLVICLPKVVVAVSYPHPPWRHILLGWLIFAWIAPIGYAVEMYRWRR